MYLTPMRVLIGYLVAIVIAIIAIIARLLFGRKPAITGSAEVIPRGCAHTMRDDTIGTDEMAERAINVPFSRVLADDSRELEYRSDPARMRLQLHLGQRKLLLNEIEFLTLHGDLATDVLYVGAAPGHHIRLLLRMFPKHRFTLYDPRDFAIKPGDRVTIRQQWFTDDDAAEWTGREHLFISDIRNATTYERGAADGDDEHDDEVANDMRMQKSWVDICRPQMAMLKFRLSWKKAEQEYFDGEIRLQPWAPKTSTETRLITDGSRMRIWDTKKYERQMYRHNTVTRVAWYDVDPAIVSAVAGMDHCYDCRSEVEILTEWAKRAGKSHGPRDIVKYVNDVTRYTNNKSLKQPPHGLAGNVRDIRAREKVICRPDSGKK